MYNVSMTHSSLLTTLIDLHSALRMDEVTPLQARKARDRRIGKTLQQMRRDPVRQLRGWLENIEIPNWRRDGHEGVQLYHVLGFILGVLGLASGWALAQVVLAYTGEAPINIVHALGLLVLPQIVLLLLWILSVIPWQLPLFATLQSALRFLNPGRLAQRLAGLFPAHARRSLEVVWERDNAVVLAPAARWLLSFWSQLFSFWFNIGALLAVFYLISFSDLAFVWSTTLNLDSATFHRLLEALAWPWHSLYPEAVPGRELVEISRYYRLEGGGLGANAVDPAVVARLGGWWPFLTAALIVYGLLPRLLTLVVSWLRFRHHLARALPRLPGVPELLARMNFPLISTSATGQEAVPPAPPPDNEASAQRKADGLTCSVVGWSESIGDRDALTRALQRLGIQPVAFFAAGGSRSTAEDLATQAALCRAPDEGVAIVVKAWEPPLLEFLDFLQGLRKRCSRGQAIIVLLSGGALPVSETDHETWRLTLRRLKDANLHIELLEDTR